MTENSRARAIEAFERLLEIMDRLRAECPWDKKQTWESLRTLTIEECYELADAILDSDAEGIREELGDLILHIVFYAKIGQEKQDFTLEDVLNQINEKLVFRHPHIFGDVEVSGSKEVEENWEKLKLSEGSKKRVLGGIPSSLPAMIKAYRIQDKARGIGFDWTEKELVWDKVSEEMDELKEEFKTNPQSTRAEEEFGDLIFSLINMARLYGINPENALERTNLKFIKRFNYLEDKTLQLGKDLRQISLADMDRLWEESKKAD